jgi:hypothetical protein
LPVAAVNRGVTATLNNSETAGTADAGQVQLYTNSLTLVFGNDQYSGGWPRLSKAVSDARKVAAALETNGFEATLKTDFNGVLQRDRVNFLQQALALRRLGDFVRLTESKPVYTVFDSCFAGTIFNVSRSAPPPTLHGSRRNQFGSSYHPVRRGRQ